MRLNVDTCIYLLEGLQQLIKMKVVVLFCLLAAVAMGRFQVRNFTTVEGAGTVVASVEVVSSSRNQPVTVTVTPLTYDEFYNMSSTLLPNIPRSIRRNIRRRIPRNTLPDPAECKDVCKHYICVHL